MNLMPGGNAPVPNQSLVVRISAGTPIDVSSFRLYDTGKVRGDLDMVFYGQRENDDSTVRYSSSGNETMFTVSLPQLRSNVQKIAFTATCDAGKNVSQVERLAIQVEANGNAILLCDVDLAGRTEAALILGELYRRNGEWKFRFVSQGFNGGLKPLAEHFGVDVADAPSARSTPTPTPTPTSSPTVNLSKVSLTKEKPSISLKKKDDYGQIRVNLNWNQRVGNNNGGFFKSMFNNNKGIDLDLAAYVELSNGYRTIVQALGNKFGSVRDEPYVELQGDDRTGAVSNGEWIYINGTEWKHIREVLIFAFIYEGVPSWESTDGSVTIHVPDQPPVETFMTEGNNRQNMCAIARLINEGGAIRVERINRYFSGHQELDQAFGWGFNWKAGSK
ncbi:TerD family protein [Pantoea sp. FN0307]|uniref:TerD family protein n=1 Tax=Pantoea sp. FN0307 TaxID=3418560 RepID=UPI003CFA4CA3